MTYPLSSAVSAGDATLATHYNNLRSDALFLGQPAANAVNLAALLERYESRLKIERLNTDQLRIVASAAEPVSLMISGYMVQAVANVDLATDQKPSGAANSYYIFANRADSSTTFTLTVSTSSTEGANQRRIGRFYWDGTKIEKDSIRTELAIFIKDLLYYVEPQTCEGRLTISTGVSVPTSEVSSSSIVYFTPHTGSRIALYVPNYGWRLYTFSELSLNLSGVSTDKNLDIWIYDNAGTLSLAYTEWSNDTLRATNIVRQDGVYCKTGALNYRYLGTVRTSASGATCDTKLKRFVWNYYNRVPRPLYRTETSTYWTYTARAWRAWNNSNDNRVQFVIGVDENPIELGFIGHSNSSGVARGLGIGLDSVSSPSSDSAWGTDEVSGFTSHLCRFCGFSGIGFHYLQLLEYGHATTSSNFYGTYTATIEIVHSAAIGSVMG